MPRSSVSAQSAYDRARIDTQKSRRTLEIAQLALGHMLKLKQAEPNTQLFINEGMPQLDAFVQETLAVHPASGCWPPRRSRRRV